jgi:hypothetical protein
VRQKHMGELVPRNYLWLEKLVGDRCRELRDGEQKDGEKDDGKEKELKEGKEGKEGGKEGKDKGKKDRDRDSKDRESFANRSSLDLASNLDGEGKGKGIPTIPWSQFINLGQICTITKVFLIYLVKCRGNSNNNSYCRKTSYFVQQHFCTTKELLYIFRRTQV